MILAKVDLLYSSHALRKRGLFENVEMTMQCFRAFYEDAAKTEAAARAEGYDGDNGSLMDYVEPSDYRTGKTFQTLAQAQQWLKAEIEAMKTVFGCGTNPRARAGQPPLPILRLWWRSEPARVHGR